jgi:hypothetical protein
VEGGKPAQAVHELAHGRESHNPATSHPAAGTRTGAFPQSWKSTVLEKQGLHGVGLRSGLEQRMGSNAGGFDFSLIKRNQLLEGKGVTLPKAWKTGTTIAGVMFKVCLCTTLSSLSLIIIPSCLHQQDGVVLGADTRSTSGSTVADKNCEKIHYIAPNIRCCGAGTAADTEAVTSRWSRSSALDHVAFWLQARTHPLCLQT